jgi:hypothetical protein
MHLGELAAARAETTAEAITFDWHGATIRCRTDLPAMPLLELAATGDELKGTAAEDDFMVVAGAFYRFLESVIDPGDWSTFRRVTTRHADGPEQLLPLIERLAEAIAGRPTVRRSASPGGPPRTTATSTGPLPSRDSTRPASALAG